MRRNTVVVLCVVIVLLSLGLQRMTSQLGRVVQTVPESTLARVQDAVKTHFVSSSVNVRTPGKTVVVQIQDPASLPSEPDLNWLREQLLQQKDFQSFQNFELQYEKAGLKGKLSGTLRP